MININAYGGNWLHILLKTVLKMTGSFGCVVTSKQCECKMVGPNYLLGLKNIN